jgi:hypothetical protein
MRLHRSLAIGVATLLSAAFSFGQVQPQLPAPPAGRAPHGKLAFVLTTGFEDLQTANMMLKQAKIAKQAGYLEDVAVVVVGRGVQLFENSGARPAPTAQLIRDARASGVRQCVFRSERPPGERCLR